MFLSMTGFGSKSYDFSWGTVLFEITSVNHKYQDFSVKLPKELLSLENKILILLRNLIGRGKVKLSAEITWAKGANVPVIDEESLTNFYNQVKKISKRNHLDAPKDITNLLLIPGIIDLNENFAELAAHDNPEIWDNMIKEVVNALMDMKKTEGEKLRIKIENDLHELEKLLKAMNIRWQKAKDDALESIRTRIENTLKHYNLEIDENRIAFEVSMAADKWDVSEELTRLEAHTEKFRTTMNLNESSGKKLDFLIQEMNREINTMGSKVADAEFRWQVVEAKTCIEKMREQIQNIE